MEEKQMSKSSCVWGPRPRNMSDFLRFLELFVTHLFVFFVLCKYLNGCFFLFL